MMSITRAQAAMEQVGAVNLEDLVGSFGEMSIVKIDEALAEMYPQENCGTNLARDIYLTCQNADWLQETFPRYF